MKKHLSHYFSLFGILIASVIGFVIFGYDKNFQFAIIAAASAGYFCWGIVHHYIHRDLNLQVLIEYLMIATVGFVIGVSVIYRA
ncbi:hypothetical protein BH10PAT1_BH10PAT1_4050 [soil metagenome]